MVRPCRSCGERMSRPVVCLRPPVLERSSSVSSPIVKSGPHIVQAHGSASSPSLVISSLIPLDSSVRVWASVLPTASAAVSSCSLPHLFVLRRSSKRLLRHFVLRRGSKGLLRPLPPVIRLILFRLCLGVSSIGSLLPTEEVVFQ